MNCPQCGSDTTEYAYPCDYRCAACKYTWVYDPLGQHRVHDAVNHPQHYTWLPNGIEVIDIVEAFNFNRGNSLKYLMRAGRKGGADELEDLKKARWYLDREIANLESARASTPSGPGSRVGD